MTTTERDLTKRETEVLLLLAQGKNAFQIADDMFVTVNTVRTYLGRLRRRYGVHTSAGLVGVAHRKGVLVSERDEELEQLKRTNAGLRTKVRELEGKLIKAHEDAAAKQATINRLAGTTRDGWPNAPRQGQL